MTKGRESRLAAHFLIADKDFAAIGRIAVAAARLEQYLEFSIWEVLGVSHDIGSILTQRQQATARAESLRDILIASTPPAQHAQIRTVCNCVTSALSQRNTFVHGVLFVAEAVTFFSDGSSFTDGSGFSSPELRVRNRRSEHALADAPNVERALVEAYGLLADLIAPHVRPGVGDRAKG